MAKEISAWYSSIWSPFHGANTNFHTNLRGITAITLSKAYLVSGAERTAYVSNRLGGMSSNITFWQALSHKTKLVNPISWGYCLVTGLKHVLFTGLDYLDGKQGVGTGPNKSGLTTAAKCLVGAIFYIPEVFLFAATQAFNSVCDAVIKKTPVSASKTEMRPLINKANTKSKETVQSTPAPTQSAALLHTAAAVQKTVNAKSVPANITQPKKPFWSRVWEAIKKNPVKATLTGVGAILASKIVMPIAAAMGIVIGVKTALTSAGIITAKLGAAAGGGASAEKIVASVEAAKAKARANYEPVVSVHKAPLIKRPSEDTYAALRAAKRDLEAIIMKEKQAEALAKAVAEQESSGPSNSRPSSAAAA